MSVVEVKVPDIGDFKDIPVIEVLVKPGDNVKAEDPLVTLESDKATVEVPSPQAGTVKELKLKVGDKVSAGTVVLTLEPAAAASVPPQVVSPPTPTETLQPSAIPEPTAKAAAVEAVAPSLPAKAPSETVTPPASERTVGVVHASPSVRRLAREFGVDLSKVGGSGPKNRILREDVQAYVKNQLAHPAESGGIGFKFTPPPQIDFAKFGAVQLQPLSRIMKLSGANLHRNWISIPHVTQHDEADITELEAFRKSQAEQAKKAGIRFTLLAFLIKAVVVALKQFPTFNASLSADGENLILKQYFHIGVAVDTPNGLVVPVIRNAEQKGLLELAKELGAVSARMRDGKINIADIQGGCFSISSLGGLGGTLFTPIINAPEVAILGVGKARTQPVWDGNAFAPRLLLPLSLYVDHRVIDGAQGARFVAFLSSVLSDIRRLVL